MESGMKVIMDVYFGLFMFYFTEDKPMFKAVKG
jgi:hypothetical protein